MATLGWIHSHGKPYYTQRKLWFRIWLKAYLRGGKI